MNTNRKVTIMCKEKEKLESRLENYQMLGLSADWIYRTWKLTNDIYLFENEDNSTYEFLKVNFINEEEKTAELLFASDNEEEILEYLSKITKNN